MSRSVTHCIPEVHQVNGKLVTIAHEAAKLVGFISAMDGTTVLLDDSIFEVHTVQLRKMYMQTRRFAAKIAAKEIDGANSLRSILKQCGRCLVYKQGTKGSSRKKATYTLAWIDVKRGDEYNINLGSFTESGHVCQSITFRWPSGARSVSSQSFYLDLMSVYPRQMHIKNNTR